MSSLLYFRDSCGVYVDIWYPRVTSFMPKYVLLSVKSWLTWGSNCVCYDIREALSHVDQMVGQLGLWFYMAKLKKIVLRAKIKMPYFIYVRFNQSRPAIQHLVHWCLWLQYVKREEVWLPFRKLCTCRTEAISDFSWINHASCPRWWQSAHYCR